MRSKKQGLKYIKKVLSHYGIYRKYREYMVYETMNVESGNFRHNKQIGVKYFKNGGNGYNQMEVATYNDILNNWLEYRPKYKKIHDQVIGGSPLELELKGNINLQIVMTAFHYMRVPEAIPSTMEKRSYYWKDKYNSHLGKGTPEHYRKLNR